MTDMTNNQQLAVAAVGKFIKNLADSDFPIDCGFNSIRKLKDYSADIATDIAETFDGFRADDQQSCAMYNALQLENPHA